MLWRWVSRIVYRPCLLVLALGVLVAFVDWTLQAAALAYPSETTSAPEHPYVILAYDGSGDFGPDTPGTKTSGWQEALDYAVLTGSDLYVKGGYGGGAVYHIQDTIHFPPAQDFRVDGGVYVLNWIGPADKDLLVIDSSMNCEYHLGILVYGGLGAAMRIRPEKPVPIDNFPIFVETEIHCQGMADPHPFTPGERQGGTGLIFDGTAAPIVHNTFRFFGNLNFKTVMETIGTFANNNLEVLHLHTNADKSTLLKLGEQSVRNTLWLAIGVDQGASDVTGIEISGKNNVIQLLPRPSNKPFAAGRMLIFDESAEGNQIHIIPEDSSFDLDQNVTDKARTPTNQVTWAGKPANIREVTTSAGQFIYTQRLYSATVRVVGGTVSSVKLLRSGRMVDYSVAPGVDILMSPGDQLQIESTTAPTIQIIPLK
ncbi:MAG: hypothetical protein HPY71_12520 [Firmicutes bacterium]|nr:hypothetical protein [Bacillota bacterium]